MKALKKLAIVIISFIVVYSSYAQLKNEKILFLSFRSINNKPELIGMTTVTGKMKIKKSDQKLVNGMTVKVVTKENNIVYKDNINDPFDGIYEYPGEKGEIRRTTLKQDTIYCTLRVPYSTSIDKIILTRMSNQIPLSKTSAMANKTNYEFRIDHNKILDRT